LNQKQNLRKHADKDIGTFHSKWRLVGNVSIPYIVSE